jgi:hypothetical protein
MGFGQLGPGPGPEWTAELFLKNKDDSLVSLATSPFRSPGDLTGTSSRYWVSKVVAVPGMGPGEKATFVVRAWKTSFESYETAQSFEASGESPPVTITLGDEANPSPLVAPAPLVGLRNRFMLGRGERPDQLFRFCPTRFQSPLRSVIASRC